MQNASDERFIVENTALFESSDSSEANFDGSSERASDAQDLRRLRAARRLTLASSLASTTQPRHDGAPHRHGMAESAGQP
jgi:hypothetical protein